MAETLYPHGGGIIKNSLASLLLSKSDIGKSKVIQMDLVNSRVSPSTGLVVGDEDEFYNDSFVFQGSDEKGNLFMTRLGFRGDGTICDSWLWVKLNNQKYTCPIEIVKDVHPGKVEAESLCYTPQKEGCWNITYSGPLDNGIENCSVNLNYKPTTKMYSFNVHADKKTYALALAEMPWSREYFKTLKSEKAERIEQGGILSGTVEMDGIVHNLTLKAFRDHSWGKRDWTMIRRYIWNLFAMEKPVKIHGGEFTHICFTTVNYISFNHLVSGWVAGPDMLLPIMASSDMTVIGGDGKAPSKYSVTFRPKGGPDIKAEVIRENDTEHPWMMQENSFEVNEAYCSVTVNGVKGYGMSEFGYTRK